MPTASLTETIKDEPETELGFQRSEEIERLLRHLSAAWDDEDFSDMPPKNLPPETQ